MKNDPLWHLVHSLSQSEKRQLVIESGDRKPLPAYLALYKWYVKQSTPQSPGKEVIAMLKLTPATLAVQKNYLSAKITDLMVRSAGDSSNTLAIRNLLSQAEVLSKRGLQDHAKRVLRKATALAEGSDMFVYQLALYDLQEDSIISHADVRDTQRFQEKKKQLFRIIENENECLIFSQRVIALGTDMNYARLPAEKKKMEVIARDPLMYGNELALSLDAYHHLMHGRIHFYTMSQDVKGVLQFYKDHFAYFDKHPETANRDPSYFLGLSYSVISSVIQLGSAKQVEDVMARWAKMPTVYKDIFTGFFTQQYAFYSSELAVRMLMLEGKTELLVREFPRIRKLKTVEHQYQITFQANMLFFIAFGNYVSGKYKEALRLLIDELSDESSGNRRYRFLLRAMILRLMIHCDQLHDEVVEDLARQLEKFLRRENCLDFPEGLIPDFFLKWAETPPRQRAALCQTALDQLIFLLTDQSDWQFGINNRFFIAWLLACAKGISLNTAILNWNNQFRTILKEKANLSDY